MAAEQLRWHLRRELVTQRYLKLFELYPIIEDTAGDYWTRVNQAREVGLSGSELLRIEEKLCSEAIFKLVELLSDLPVFYQPCVEIGYDVVDQAFEEALVVLDHYPDVAEFRAQTIH